MKRRYGQTSRRKSVCNTPNRARNSSFVLSLNLANASLPSPHIKLVNTASSPNTRITRECGAGTCIRLKFSAMPSLPNGFSQSAQRITRYVKCITNCRCEYSISKGGADNIEGSLLRTSGNMVHCAASFCSELIPFTPSPNRVSGHKARLANRRKREPADPKASLPRPAHRKDARRQTDEKIPPTGGCPPFASRVAKPGHGVSATAPTLAII
ncbi:Uncharacterised protein [Burkholderia pseudomallei]|nr:Uncharacterised protein [Burkholderia pseudomallei]CPF10311.1 Uncharacterised protein [Burkholderia pseudomallei]